MTHSRNRRGAALEALALAAVFLLSWALFYQLTLRPASDISIHATWAAEGSFADPVTFTRWWRWCCGWACRWRTRRRW